MIHIVFLIYTVIFFAFLYYTCIRYEYWGNVFIYTIGMGLLPTLFSHGDLASLIVAMIIRFIIGLILIKLLIKINDFFENGVYFLIAGILLEGLIYRFVVTFLIILCVVI